MKATLSAVLIIKNEERHLAQCLQSLDFADEIIVLDSGSSDASLTIAQQHGAIVKQNCDWQGFGIQRQRAQQYATGTWTLMIDADERVTAELAANITAFIRHNPSAIGKFARKSWFFGRFMRYSGWYPDYVTRLYPTALAAYDDTLVHESLQNPNKLPIKTLKGELLHYTYDDMHQFLKKTVHYTQSWTADRQHKSVSLASALAHSLVCFLKMYIFKLGFLDGRQGLLLALLSAQTNFIKYAALLTQNNPKYQHDHSSNP